MYYDIISAGFGGQGVMMIGRLLAQAGMIDNFFVTWYPSYGAEMRGGTANCTVVISNEEIGFPMSNQPQAVIIMNKIGAKVEDRNVVLPAREAAKEAEKSGKGNAGIFCGASIELHDGTIITGKNSASGAR